MEVRKRPEPGRREAARTSESFALAGPFGRKLPLGRQIAHGGNLVLAWMALNDSMKQDPAGNIKPDKAKSRDRIDGLAALIMAVGRASVQEVARTPDIWRIG